MRDRRVRSLRLALALATYLCFLAAGPLHAILHTHASEARGAEHQGTRAHCGCSCCAHRLQGSAPAQATRDAADGPDEPAPDDPVPGDDPCCPICQVVAHGFVETQAPPPLPCVRPWIASVPRTADLVVARPTRDGHRARAPPAC